MIFGYTGNLGATTAYLLPSIVQLSQLPVTRFEFKVSQNTILCSGTVKSNATIPNGHTQIFHIWKVGSPDVVVYTLALTEGETMKMSNNVSCDLSSDELYYATVTNSTGFGNTVSYVVTLGLY
jgi:hypothetical protein